MLYLMQYNAEFLSFVDGCLLYFTDWSNNTFVYFMLLGALFLGDETILTVWVSNLSELPLSAWIIALV